MPRLRKKVLRRGLSVKIDALTAEAEALASQLSVLQVDHYKLKSQHDVLMGMCDMLDWARQHINSNTPKANQQQQQQQLQVTGSKMLPPPQQLEQCQHYCWQQRWQPSACTTGGLISQQELHLLEQLRRLPYRDNPPGALTNKRLPPAAVAAATATAATEAAAATAAPPGSMAVAPATAAAAAAAYASTFAAPQRGVAAHSSISSQVCQPDCLNEHDLHNEKEDEEEENAAEVLGTRDDPLGLFRWLLLQQPPCSGAESIKLEDLQANYAQSLKELALNLHLYEYQNKVPKPRHGPSISNMSNTASTASGPSSLAQPGSHRPSGPEQQQQQQQQDASRQYLDRIKAVVVRHLHTSLSLTVMQRADLPAHMSLTSYDSGEQVEEQNVQHYTALLQLMQLSKQQMEQIAQAHRSGQHLLGPVLQEYKLVLQRVKFCTSSQQLLLREQVQRLWQLLQKAVLINTCLSSMVLGCLSYVQVGKLAVLASPFPLSVDVLVTAVVEHMRELEERRQQQPRQPPPQQQQQQQADEQMGQVQDSDSADAYGEDGTEGDTGSDSALG